MGVQQKTSPLQNGWLELSEILSFLGPGIFAGAFAVSFRECNPFTKYQQNILVDIGIGIPRNINLFDFPHVCWTWGSILPIVQGDP